MLKYIFHEADYMKWNSEEYQYHVHDEYTESTVKTGRVYNQTKVRGFTMPGNSDSVEQFGYASNMWMGANSFAPGGVYEAHIHETFQYFYVIAGKARVIVGGEERIAEKGTWIFVPPFIDHHMENIGDEAFTYILVGGNPPARSSEILR